MPPIELHDVPSNTADSDAVAMLRTDHRQTAELFQAYARMVAQSVAEPARRRLAELICTNLTVHDQLETQLFYPLAREALINPAPIGRAYDEHAVIRRLVAQIRATPPGRHSYDRRIARLERLLHEHMRFEDEAIFATLRRQGVQFGDLAAVLARWREHLSSGENRRS